MFIQTYFVCPSFVVSDGTFTHIVSHIEYDNGPPVFVGLLHIVSHLSMI
jgi:hypothetical protein